MTIDPWKGGQRIITLSKAEVSQLIRLLGVLQTSLESSIETSCIAGTKTPDPRDVNAAHNVRLDRRDWKQAEEMVKKLEAARKANRRARQCKTTV